MSQVHDLDDVWVDFGSAAALLGVSRTDLAWAMVNEVTFSTRVPAHEGQPMLCVGCLHRWAGSAPELRAPEPEPT
jgi:hypothetical protein